jgi:predicted transposase YbfD/YdcC
MVSAWGCEPRLVLAQVATEAKSNEITAVPKLLQMLSLEGCIVTVDALNCQREIARQVIDRKGDYALALKGNQGTLHDDVRTFLDDPQTRLSVSDSTVDADHGRIETRTGMVSTDIEWLQRDHRWPGLAAIGKVVRSHWAIENRLHRCLDVTMNEDRARNRMDNGPQNLAVLRHMALNLVRNESSKGSLPKKLRRAAWSDTFLDRVLAQL